MSNHITPWQERLHALSTQDEIDAAIAAEIAELREALTDEQDKALTMTNAWELAMNAARTMEAENKRLREALEKFILCCDFESPTDEAYFIATDTFSELWDAAETAARAALKGDV